MVVRVVGRGLVLVGVVVGLGCWNSFGGVGWVFLTVAVFEV